jgi:hypothetical protein
MRPLGKSNTSSSEKRFIQDAYEDGEIIDGEVLPILSVRESRSRKGFLITTEKALVFLYKSSGWIYPLLEEIRVFCEEKHGYDIVLVVDPDEESGIRVEVDEQVPRIWTVSKKLGNGTLMESVSPLSGQKTGKGLTRRERSQLQG